MQTNIKGSIFKPLYLNFPILDKWPYIFTSRKRGFKLVQDFEDLLYQLVRNRPRDGSIEKQSAKSGMLIDLLDDALESGSITDRQYRDNIKITFITGHENVQLLLNSLFFELGRNQVRPVTSLIIHRPWEAQSLTSLIRIGGSTQAQRRNTSDRSHQSLPRYSQQATLPFIRRERTPPPLPTYLPTYQPHRD